MLFEFSDLSLCVHEAMASSSSHPALDLAERQQWEQLHVEKGDWPSMAKVSGSDGKTLLHLAAANSSAAALRLVSAQLCQSLLTSQFQQVHF